MKENEYYMTRCDEVYKMMRKSFIYVYKVHKKVFYYYYIDDWSFEDIYDKSGIYQGNRLRINEVPTEHKRIGKIADSYCFKLVKREYILLAPNCP